MSNQKSIYGGIYNPSVYAKKSILDDFLETLIIRKCNRIDDICNRLKISYEKFMDNLNTDKFVTNGYYIAPKY